MKKRMLIRATIVLVCLMLAIGTMIAFLGTLPSHDDFTYNQWAKQAHYSTPCEVQSVARNDRQANAYRCKGTKKIPTKDQLIAWESYQIWVNCYQYHSLSACQELND